MDNIFPAFKHIQVEEPAKNQSHAHFVFAASDEQNSTRANASAIPGSARTPKKVRIVTSLLSWVEGSQKEDDDSDTRPTANEENHETNKILFSTVLPAAHEQVPDETLSSKPVTKKDSSRPEPSSRLKRKHHEHANNRKNDNVFLTFSYFAHRLCHGVSAAVKKRHRGDRYKFYVQDENNRINLYEVNQGRALTICLRKSSCLFASDNTFNSGSGGAVSRKGIAISLLSRGLEGDKTILMTNDLQGTRNGGDAAVTTVQIFKEKGDKVLGIEVEEKVHKDFSTYLEIKSVIKGSIAWHYPEIKAGSNLVGIAGRRVQSINELSLAMEALIQEKDCIDIELENTPQNVFLTGTTGNGGQAHDDTVDTTCEKSVSLTHEHFGKSIDDDYPIILSFQNNHSLFALRVEWVDYDGNFVLRKELAPGENYMERSYATHFWVCTLLTTPTGDDEWGSENEHTDSSAISVPLSVVFCLGDDACQMRKRFHLLWNARHKSLSLITKVNFSDGHGKMHYLFESDIEQPLRDEHEFGLENCVCNDRKTVQGCLPKLLFNLIG